MALEGVAENERSHVIGRIDSPSAHCVAPQLISSHGPPIVWPGALWSIPQHPRGGNCPPRPAGPAPTGLHVGAGGSAATTGKRGLATCADGPGGRGGAWGTRRCTPSGLVAGTTRHASPRPRCPAALGPLMGLRSIPGATVFRRAGHSRP